MINNKMSLMCRNLVLTRLLSNCKVHRIGQYASYRSQYNVENIYPNSAVNYEITKPESIKKKGFSGFIPIEDVKVSYSINPSFSSRQLSYRSEVPTNVEMSFHVSSAQWISEATKSKLLQREAGHITKDGYLVVRSDKTRVQLLNQADCLDRLRTMIFNAEGDKTVQQTTQQKPPSSVDLNLLRQKKSELKS